MSPAASRARHKRAYRSAVRAEGARRTRERILAAASAEFLRVGYTATTMRTVAAAAGVSVPTVELVFGTKAHLLRAAITYAIRGDTDPVPMLQRSWAKHAERAASVAEFLAMVARVLVESAQRSAGLVVAAFEAANVDESMQVLADQLNAQRAETAAWIVDGVIGCSSLRPAVDRTQAVDTVWLLMDPHGFRVLTRDRGWTPEQFGRWFSESVGRLLVDHVDAPTDKRKRENEMSDQTDPGVDNRLVRPGSITYLHIPATDARRAAAFYRDVFGWTVNNPDSDRPSFDDPSGQLSGAWLSRHLIAHEPGLLPYIYVDDVAASVEQVLAHGGEVVTDPYPEGLLTVATFRDPSGNVLGLWHDSTR